MQFVDSSGHQLAVNYTPGVGSTGVLFCGGFKSNQQGQKALALDSFCTREQIPFIRFDYSGHGSSQGEFIEGSIDSWLQDTLHVIDSFKETEKWIVVGSSMGAWIAVLAATARQQRVAALITIAAAPDFTERLMTQRFSATQLATLEREGQLLLPSEYDDGSPYPITSKLLEESRQHCVLQKPVHLDVPVRLLHGTDDTDVPYQLSVELMQAITSADCQLTLIKNGDHRLSEPAQLALLEQTIRQLHQHC